MKGNKAGQRSKNKSTEIASYDKIFREVSPSFLSVLTERVLKLDVVEFEELKDKLQVTRQLETDTLRKVTDSKGNTSILHVEIESKNDRMMPARMAHYFTMLHLLHKLPIKQYVIYIGDRPCTMSDCLTLPSMQFNYELISISDIPHRMLLDPDRPESEIFALLGDLEGKPIEEVVGGILERLAEEPIPDSEKRGRVEQLRISAQLRNFDLDKIQKDMSTVISKIFKAERDPFYKMGEKRGEKRGDEQGMTRVVQRLIVNTGSTDAEISRMTDVPVEVVRKIRSEMKKAD